MNVLTKNIDVWNSYSIEPKVYCILLENSGELVGQRLDIIISNFITLFNVERDFETRIRFISNYTILYYIILYYIILYYIIF